jgi:hypothetical protein
MCYKDPAGLLTASVVWPGAWRGPIGIKPGRIYPRSSPDQPSDWPTTKDCSALTSLRICIAEFGRRPLPRRGHARQGSAHARHRVERDLGELPDDAW